MTYASTLLSQNPVHYWRLQEATAAPVDIGSAPATLTAGNALKSQGGAAYAGSVCQFFDGVLDGHMGSIASLPSAAYTVTALVKMHATFPTSFHCLVAALSADGTQRSQMIARRNAANNRLCYWDNTNTFQESSFTLAATTWYHIAWVISGTSARILVDGVQVLSATITAPADTYNAASIGVASPTALQGMKGWIQDVAMFSSVLSDAQIAAQHAAIATGGNLGPTASAGPDQSNIEAYGSVQLAGSGSDPDGSIASYSWNHISGASSNAALSSTTTASPSYTAPGTLAGSTDVWRLTVTDNQGATDTDDISVTVLPARERAVIGGVEVPVNIRAVGS